MNKKKFKFLFSLIFGMFVLLLPREVKAETFQVPFSGDWVQTSDMYDRTGRANASNGYHDGWDMVAQGDTNIYVPAGGEVVSSGWTNGGGNTVTIKHELGSDLVIDGVNYGNVIYTSYMHMANASPLKQGDIVQQGDFIGVMGNTGGSFGAHLHFGVATEATGGSFAGLKSLDTAVGVSPTGDTWSDSNKPIYNVIASKSNPLKAAINPAIIFGLDVNDPKVDAKTGEVPKEEEEKPVEERPAEEGGPEPEIEEPHPSNDPEDPDASDEVVEEEALENGEKEGAPDGKPRETRHYSNGTPIITEANGIVNKVDHDSDLDISQDIIEYGKLGTLEDEVSTLALLIHQYAKVFAVVFLFLSVILSGANIILNRANAQKRMNFMTGIGGIGVAFFIISFVTLFLAFISEWYV